MNDGESPEPVPPSPPTLADTLRDKLSASATPLTVKELAKGLTRPKKVKAAEFEASLPEFLEDDIRGGRVFQYPSGTAGAVRYWGKDEAHAIRQAAEMAAETPTTVADLTKAVSATSAKAAKGFVEGLVRDLIGEDRLFEHPPKKKNGPPLFGRTAPPPPPPPPHPLEIGKAKKDFDKLVAAVQKLLGSVAGVTGDELVTRLAARLRPADAQAAEVVLTPGATAALGGSPPSPSSTVLGAHLEATILEHVGKVPSMLLSDLRARMPESQQGPEFDAAVIRLAEDMKVVINADADPRRFSEGEQRRFVRDDHGHTFTTISKRS